MKLITYGFWSSFRDFSPLYKVVRSLLRSKNSYERLLRRLRNRELIVSTIHVRINDVG